jgi:hypothetical protein
MTVAEEPHPAGPLLPHLASHNATLWNGTIYTMPVTPSALKASAPKGRRTAAQLEFIVHMHSKGEPAAGGKHENKLSPEQANTLMKLKGTASGYKLCRDDYMTPNIHGFPSFSMCDILEAQQIKAYFGETNVSLRQKLSNTL